MHIGFTLPAPADADGYRRFRDIVRAIEASGFDHVLVLDHVIGASLGHRPDWTGPYSNEDPFHEPLIALGHAAALCELELVSAVLVLPQRQTALVAKQVAEIDLLSGGRVRLGVGVGWNPVEYQALGMGFGDRGERLEEQVTLLRQLWSHPSITFEGRDHVVDDAGIHPLPSSPPPVWLGGGGSRKVLERIGRIADGWMVPRLVPGRGFEEAREVVLEAAQAEGRGTALGIQAGVLARSPADVDHVLRATERWADAGVTHLHVTTGTSHLSTRSAIELIEATGSALRAYSSTPMLAR